MDYVEQLMQHEYPSRKFIFLADDWGTGIASHSAAAHIDRPLFVADTIVNFIRHIMGRSAMADINTRPGGYLEGR